MTTEMVPVASSNIREIGYDESARCLYVQFADRGNTAGALWRYQAVQENTFKSMLHAESVGGFFAANIKGQYAGEKVG